MFEKHALEKGIPSVYRQIFTCLGPSKTGLDENPVLVPRAVAYLTMGGK